MKVGFHVYLMPWFAELCLSVDGNEDWHVENRLRHSSPPQVLSTVGAESGPVSQLLPLHLSLQTDNINSMTRYFLNAFVCMYISLFNKRSFLKTKSMLALRVQHTATKENTCK